MTVRVLARVGARVGEGPIWWPEGGFWLWLDLQGRRVWRTEASGATSVVAEGFAEDLACLARLPDGAALLVTARAFQRLDPGTGEVAPLPCPVALPEGTQFNDGKVDRSGALWVGSNDSREAEPLGRLWRVAGGRAEEVARGFVVSNGPAFALDGRAAFFADSFGRRILRFSIGAGGEVGPAEVFGEVPEVMGLPDGMTVDAEGALWVGHWDGARLTCWSPEGRLLADVAMPARNVTSLAFGGGGLRDVLVTSAQLFPGQEGVPPGPHGDPLWFRGEVAGVEEPVLAPDWLGQPAT